MVNNYDCLAFIKQVYPKELPLNTAIITSDSRQTLDLNIFLSQSKFNTSVYDKSVNCSFPIVNFPFLDGDVLAVLPYAVYISQLSRFVLLLIMFLISMTHLSFENPSKILFIKAMIY
jgi:hypothetical protein